MTQKPECVTLDDPVQLAAQIMRDSDIGVVPVVDGSQRRLKGIITDRDIAVRYVAEGRKGQCRIGELMSNDLVTARADDDIRQIIDLMKTEQVRRIPIVDDNHTLIGIVAQADLALDGVSDRVVGEVVEEVSKPVSVRE
jgi:CBS domain-containing protein